MSKFLHLDYNNDDAKAIAIPPVFPENSHAKNHRINKKRFYYILILTSFAKFSLVPSFRFPPRPRIRHIAK